MPAMTVFARMVATLLVAVFVAGTVVDAANATSMSVAMSSDTMAAEAMDDCEACPPSGDGKAAACNQACLAPFSAVPAVTGFGLAPVTADAVASSPEELTGRTGPPDPSPPRTLV